MKKYVLTFGLISGLMISTLMGLSYLVSRPIGSGHSLLLGYVTMVASFLPYMVPFSITVEQAAAPHSSLAFMFWGAGVFVLPVTLIYTLVVYWVFKGKIAPSAEYQ